MKKFFCILLAAMLLMIFTACGCSTNADVGGNTGNDAGENSRMSGDGIIDGDNERTNDGSMQGGASAEFQIGGGNGNNGGDTNGNGGNTNGNGSSTSSNGSGRRTSFEKGELSQLASLVGANDEKVIEILGEGKPDTVISGNITVVKRRTYNNIPVFGNAQNVILSYDKDGAVDSIEISTVYAPILWSMNISNEYGPADKISSDGLDYDYYSSWKGKKEKIELVCWNDKMSILISKK